MRFGAHRVRKETLLEDLTCCALMRRIASIPRGNADVLLEEKGPTILAPMGPSERNGSLAVYDPGQIRRLGVG